MGNRAIIKPIESNTGVYLHWHGGKTSVTAFLKYCELHNYRDFGGENADGYGVARFCQVVGNFFGGSISIGVCETGDTKEDAMYIDNGIYIIDGWKIVRTVGEQYDDDYDLTEMLLKIDSRMPEKERLGEDFITADEVPLSEIKVGDQVFVLDLRERPELHTVTSIISPNTKGGKSSKKGIPCISKYAEGNPNNELHGVNGKIRRLKKKPEKATKIANASELKERLNAMEIGDEIEFAVINDMLELNDKNYDESSIDKSDLSFWFGFKKVEVCGQVHILIAEYTMGFSGYFNTIPIDEYGIDIADIQNLIDDIKAYEPEFTGIYIVEHV